MNELLRQIKDRNLFTHSTTMGNVYCKCTIQDYSKPLVISFANAGSLILSKEIESDTADPWAHDFVIKQGYNALCFACIDSRTWYRDTEFIQLLQQLSVALEAFPNKFGYGASMGGFAVATFADMLKLTSMLILNPISTLNQDLTRWEGRFDKAKNSLDWTSEYYDAAQTKTPGYIVYDNLFHVDSNHAKRFKSLTRLRLPGFGHGMAIYLNALKMLKGLFNDFVNQRIDQPSFQLQAKQRKSNLSYYKWLLSKENIHLTPSRKKIIESHRLAILALKGRGINSPRGINDLRDAAMKLEKIDPKLSYRLMKMARLLRPDGEFITKKVKDYEETIKQLAKKTP